MTFLKGDKCELRVLEKSEHEVQTWTKAVNAGLTTHHLITGSKPMKAYDVKAYWDQEEKAGSIIFGIWEQRDVFIGTCGLHSFRDIYHSYEARFLIFDPDAIGKGIGKEACRMLVKYAFDRLNANRVWLGVSEDNIRALKCYIDCGFKYEGRLVEELYYDGKYHDALRFAILRSEHEALPLLPQGC